MKFTIFKDCQIEFEVEAESLEEAEKKLEAQTPNKIFIHNLFGDDISVARILKSAQSF
jgi:hypothetical protein